MPLFSIITVVRDDLAGLIRTHASLAQQVNRNFEWVVVDGASKDGGQDWLAAHRDGIAWLCSAPDDGLYHAMNIGLGAALGRYVLFLNAGDTLADAEVLATIAPALARAGWPDFCYGDAWEGLPGRQPRLKTARTHHWAWYGMFTHHQAMFCRRAALDGLAFRPNYPIGADYAFILEVLKRAHGVVYLALPVCVFALGGCSGRSAGAGRHDQWCIRKELLNHGFLRCELIRTLQLLAYYTRKLAPFLFNALRYTNRLSRSIGETAK